MVFMRLARLAGARPEILRVARADAPRFTMSAAGLLCSAALAAVAAFIVVRLATVVSWPVAVLGALGWGAIVLITSRLLLVSIQRRDRWPSRYFSISFRVLAALLVGLVTATPVTLAGFGSAIESEIEVAQARERQAIQASLGQVQISIGEMTGEESRLLATLTGRADPKVALDPRVRAATADYTVALVNYSQAQHELECELAGTCGAGMPGEANTTLHVQALAEQASAELEVAQARLNDVSARVTVQLGRAVTPEMTARAQTELQVLQVDLSNAQARRTTLIAEAASISTGFLDRLDVFGRLIGSDGMTRWSWLALVALFSALNALPFLVRYASVNGSPTLYDRLVERHERAVDELAKLEANLMLSSAAEHTTVQAIERPPEATEPAEGTTVDPRPARSLWQAFSDGIGSVFGMFGDTRDTSPRLPLFEATIADDVNRLYELARRGRASHADRGPR
jgi:Domain of unknown function (DUF4407)